MYIPHWTEAVVFDINVTEPNAHNLLRVSLKQDNEESELGAFLLPRRMDGFSNSNVVKITDHLNNATRYTYNELDLLATETDARGFVTTYTYDSEENLASVQDPLDNVTTYTYDNLNRLHQETAVGVGTRTYSYDEVSNLIQLLDRNGRIVQFAYDDWNRQTAELWLDGDRIVNTVAYDYDAASQLVEVEDSVAKYSYEYDNDGRLTKEIRDTFGFTDKVVLDYTYDGAGNVLTVTDTVGSIQLSTETYTYDAQDRVTTISQTGNGVTPKTAVVTYDDAGQLEQLEVLNAFTTAITFDLDGRPVTRTHTTAVGEVLAYGYEFDEVNRITTITGPNGESSFSYDSTDQLTSASSDFQEDESYDYDETGNRLGNEIGAHNRLLNDGIYSYEYDAEGNRIQRIELATGVVTDYEWDWRNRLVEVSSSNELGEVLSRSQYQYDAFDRRVAKSVDSDGDGIYELVEGFVYNDDSILLVLDGDEISQRYFYGPGTDWVLAEETAGEGVEYALTNHLNSVEYILDSAGEVINRIIYDSFGGITSETNPGVDVRYGFTGRDFDKETGLGYNRTRYYDFVTGTFVSVDRLGFEAGDVNLYRYVGNSPTIYVDPSGMFRQYSTNRNLTVQEPGTPIEAAANGEASIDASPSTDPSLTTKEDGLVIPVWKIYHRGLPGLGLVAAQSTGYLYSPPILPRKNIFKWMLPSHASLDVVTFTNILSGGILDILPKRLPELLRFSSPPSLGPQDHGVVRVERYFGKGNQITGESVPRSRSGFELNDFRKEYLSGSNASQKFSGWISRKITPDNLTQIPDLVSSGPLSPDEFDLLRRVVDAHANSNQVAASPFLSTTTRPGLAKYLEKIDSNKKFLSERNYIGTYELPISTTIDVNTFLARATPEGLSQHVDINDFIPSDIQEGLFVEYEVLTTTDLDPHLRSIRPNPVGPIKHASLLSTMGEVIEVADLTLSVTRVINAEPEDRFAVAAEEVAGYIGGTIGSAAGASACIGFGIATGGWGLLGCGLVGGFIGGSVFGTLPGTVRDLYKYNDGK